MKKAFAFVLIILVVAISSLPLLSHATKGTEKTPTPLEMIAERTDKAKPTPRETTCFDTEDDRKAPLTPWEALVYYSGINSFGSNCFNFMNYKSE